MQQAHRHRAPPPPHASPRLASLGGVEDLQESGGAEALLAHLGEHEALVRVDVQADLPQRVHLLPVVAPARRHEDEVALHRQPL
eukprot:CAMPEP_0195592644 /NCGR_PEP_ID=MMETSP0815-20121206/458_1 /TAXON_ID=97485 /ORGANISM="Prymnesium parvum, Strain Texoma1" /LENGTH=83 /DNA_ID=CAMNT_0040731725 /DNA_START=290 /DNA_END=538 /DNA_ORIENTATION=+